MPPIVRESVHTLNLRRPKGVRKPLVLVAGFGIKLYLQWSKFIVERLTTIKQHLRRNPTSVDQGSDGRIVPIIGAKIVR